MNASPPAWWPADEPWPPKGRAFFLHRRRARFVRRAGWFSFWPLWILFWFVATIGGSFFRVGRPFDGGVTLLLMCAAAAAAVAVILRWLARPIGDIVSAAERIARRDYRVRVEVPTFGPAWIGDTARAFNAMAGQLDAQDQARRHLMADIAHELRTPLAVVQGKIEGLIDGVYPTDSEHLQGILDDTHLLARLVEDLRTLSTAESGAMGLSKEPTDVLALAADVTASIESRAADAGVVLQVVEPDPARALDPIDLDPIRIREVLTNLVANALRYTPRGGRVNVLVAPRPNGVEVSVIDTGAGIAEQDLPHVFDRFYKGAGSSGSGLGLTIARSLVEAHGGTIRAESRPGVGTTIVFFLPR